MRVFIAWSGSLSEELGNEIRNWLPNVIQSVEPYFTPSDLEKGSQWPSELAKVLNESKVGLICVTTSNINSDWILFEAGAISKTLGTTRVCPILFDVKPTDLKGPLAQFQATTFEREDFKKLIGVINNGLEEGRLPDKRVDTVFDMWWPALHEKLVHILSQQEVSEEQIRTEREMLEEVLQLTRRMNLRTRPALNRSVNPQAVSDLLEGYINLHDKEANRTGGYQNTLDLLKSMHKPVDHIIRNHTGDTEKNSALVERFRELTYMVVPGEDDEEVDEE